MQAAPKRYPWQPVLVTLNPGSSSTSTSAAAICSGTSTTSIASIAQPRKFMPGWMATSSSWRGRHASAGGQLLSEIGAPISWADAR